jgi:hypothetical protein
MKTAIIEILYDPEVIGFSRSRGEFFVRDQKFIIRDRSPFFADEGIKFMVGFGPEGGETLLREFLALGAERAIYLRVPDYGVKSFDLYPVCNYLIKNFPENEFYTSNEEIYHRLGGLKVEFVKEKIEGRLPTALEIVKARNKKLEIAEDFKYETPFNFIYGEEW